MTDRKSPDGFSLRRWSARKRAVAEAPPAAAAQAAPPIDATPIASAPARDAPQAAGDAAPVARTTKHDPPAATGAATVVAQKAEALPPIDSLTPQSDFTPFMRSDVDPTLRRAALRKLFTDPHFNVMDGLDVYIDDYSKPDPIAPEIVKTLAHARYLFAPPPTRVNAQGHVEDVPPEELEKAAAAAVTAEAAPQAAALPSEAGEAPPAAAVPPAQIELPIDESPPRK